MIQYSIADLESLTGIKAHTIRIWEKRYATIKPSRTETNIRYYNDDDLKRLINISALINSGMKISEISNLSEGEMIEEINSRMKVAKKNNEVIDTYISQLINSALDFDEIAFDKILSGAMLRMGISNAYLNVLIPLLNRIGLLWSTSAINPAHEHFISNLLRQKLFSVIDTLPLSQSNNNVVILFLPDFEDHDIGLLMADYLLRQSGRRTIFLGQRVPLVSLEKVFTRCNCDQMLFFIIQTKPIDLLQNYVEQLSNTFSNIKIFIAGNSKLISQLLLPENIIYLKSPESIIDKMNNNSAH